MLRGGGAGSVAGNGRACCGASGGCGDTGCLLTNSSTCIAKGGVLPDFDCHLPLLSLPRVLGTREHNIPGDAPYLKAPPEALVEADVVVRAEEGVEPELLGGAGDRQQLVVARALLRLGDPGPAWTLLGQGGPDRRQRTALIHALAPYGVRPEALADRLPQLPDRGEAGRPLGADPGALVPGQLPVPLSQSEGGVLTDADSLHKLYIRVTELIGSGVNPVTGDYSRGASGFWIENGRRSYPVSEVTIAGNLIAMFGALEPANDLEFRYGSNAPTVRIEGLTVAGR